MYTLSKLTGGMLPLICCCLLTNTASAQLSVSAQLRTRSELRDGQGAPAVKGAKPAFFISQRSRLMLGYSTYRLKLGLSVQDVRVWGQDASTINRTTTEGNNGFLLHEAWADVLLSDTADKKNEFSVKAGRQELMYDDQRLIGNLDWLQQGRRHDAVIVKFRSDLFTIHGGFAYNQNKENASGTVYNPTPPGNYTGNTNGGTMYKSFEYIHANKKYHTGNVSFLFFADQFSKYHNEMQNDKPVKLWENGSWGRYTTGFYISQQLKQLDITGAAYYQGGKNSDGRDLSAGLVSVSTLYTFNSKFSAGPGFDYTTGGSTSGKSNAFDPLYGTPHKFWGFMDYFYAGSGFGNKGLADYYIKSKYKISSALQLTGDIHQFTSAGGVYTSENQKMTKNFGTEIDLVMSYSISKIIALEGGYSHFFNTSSLSSAGVKNVANAQSNNNWAYLTLNIRPDFK